MEDYEVMTEDQIIQVLATIDKIPLALNNALAA